MKIIHHIGCNFDAPSQVELANYGISVSLGIDAFDIEEADPRWKNIQTWIQKRHPIVTTTTSFTNRELQSATNLSMVPLWHHGYPMPDLDDGYIANTFDTASGCLQCGVGWRQKAPFRMKSEPKWGKRNVLQLNWVFDEYFVTPEAYRTVFQPFGIPCFEVLHYRTEKPLISVVQLVIDSIANGFLSLGSPADEVCAVCGKGKYHARTRGFFPKLRGSTDAKMFKTQDYFGSGGSAWRAVVVANQIYEAITNAGLKGVKFYPLAE